MKPKLTISVVSNAASWSNTYIPSLVQSFRHLGHRVHWVHDAARLGRGDLAFFLSYGRIVGPEILAKHRHNLVAHASDLPRGRGWSPATWQVLEGKRKIPVVLFEAVEALDAGAIYLKESLLLRGHELIDEIREALDLKIKAMCLAFVKRYPAILKTARPQRGRASMYRRRRPMDSRLDVRKSLAAQFNALRVADNDRYPAFFDYRGHRYTLKITKAIPALEAKRHG